MSKQEKEEGLEIIYQIIENVDQRGIDYIYDQIFKEVFSLYNSERSGGNSPKLKF